MSALDVPSDVASDVASDVPSRLHRPAPAVVEAWSHEPNLDFLRSVAVLCVVARHVMAVVGFRGNGWFQAQALGIFGVLLFFVHTSLVLSVSLARRRLAGPVSPARLHAAFLVRRFFRIYPLSIAVVLLAYFVLIPRSDAFGLAAGIPTEADRRALFANLALVQDLTQSGSVLGPLWTLPVEVQMYLVLPALFFLVERRGARAIALVALPLALLGFVVRSRLDLPLTVLRYAPCFVAGVLAFGLLRARRPLPFLALPAALVAGLAAHLAITTGRVGIPAGLCILVTIPLACVLPFIARMRGVRLRAATHALAKHSYGVYLFHDPCIWLAFGKGGWLGFAGSLAASLVLITVASVVSYQVIEAPLIRVGELIAARITRA